MVQPLEIRMKTIVMVHNNYNAELCTELAAFESNTADQGSLPTGDLDTQTDIVGIGSADMLFIQPQLYSFVNTEESDAALIK